MGVGEIAGLIAAIAFAALAGFADLSADQAGQDV